MAQKTVRTDQKRVEYVLNQIKNWQDNKGVSIAKLSTVADGLPAMIRMNGLGQTMAFLKTNKGELQAIEKTLSDWLIKETKIYDLNASGFIDAMVNGNQRQYRQAQAETMLLLNWFKKLLKSESGSTNKAETDNGR